MTMETNGVGNAKKNNAPTSNTMAQTSSIVRPSPLRRRRLSRGLIAAGNNRSNSGQNVTSSGSGTGDVGDGATGAPRQGDEHDNITPIASSTSGGGGGGNTTTPHHSSNSIGSTGPSSPDGPSSAMSALPKPNYSGRLAQACVQNALQMGVITKFSLCPQGKARKNFVNRTKALRERKQRKDAQAKAKGGVDSSNTNNDNQKAQDAFLQNPPYRSSPGGDGSVAAEEEYSSGDDDDFDGSVEDDDDGNRGGNIPLHSALDPLQNSKEPYFIPTGADAASMGLQGGQVPGMTLGKLPFNYRKVRYFDSVTASDRAVARTFLQGEIRNAKRLRSAALCNYLKRARVRERERVDGEKAASEGAGDASSGDLPTTKPMDEEDVENDTVDLQAEQTALATALSRFPHELTPTLSAALLIESLAMNHHESIEGMAKCYDGIVSAGTALLDLANDKESSASNTPIGKSKPPSNKLTASEIMGALAPLLITTLEQSSGETLVSLSTLRNYCGTKRYQRRFVQRIAPFLVRPPNAAMWCLRHQSDIEPIIAAVEMILDNASEVFSKGWFERGRNMLKDTQRAETLRTAASQLRRLNSPSPTEGGGMGLLVGLSSTPGQANHRRVGGGSVVGGKGGVGMTNDSLAEWEVVAVDQSIRQSILDVFSRDWSRISTLNLSPKESETPGFGGSRSRRGISTAKSKEWNDNAATTSASSPAGGDQRSTTSSQVSGLMPASSLRTSSKLPLSPRSTNSVGSQLPSMDALESTFGPSFSSQQVIVDDANNERSMSPTMDYAQGGPSSTPLSPARGDSLNKQSQPKTPPTQYQELRPPDNTTDRISMPTFGESASPSRSRGYIAPLSPHHDSDNASTTSSMGTLRSTGTSTNQMSSSNRDQYRALTSTAAERKRTVAACRALRAQITQFEDAFIQMHGRAPKGAGERAPLASTYMQYREWKRAIRADAACRIQALCRGARMRWMLTGSMDVRIASFVSKRSAVRSLAAASSKQPVLNHLSIPLDMGGDDASDLALTRTRLETRTARGDDSVEVEMVPVPAVSPNWRNRQQQPQQQQHRPIGGGNSPIASHSSHKSSSSRSRISFPDVFVMSLAELHQRKRELKQQLKLYDMNFHAQHGRMPEKREKEPIRHLYESYNAYKNQITTIEKGDAQPGPGTLPEWGDTTDAAATPEVSPKNLSPTYNSGNTSPQQGQFSRTSSPGASSSDSGVEGNNNSPVEETTTSPKNASSSTEVASQDLASLKAEKATLHQMLRSYEKDFFKQHKRQVSSFADIRPVASQYRRYKEIKKAIAQKSSSG